MSDPEIWRPIERHPHYAVSTLGRIRNSVTAKILKPPLDRDGYLTVMLYVSGKGTRRKIHQLVLEAFVGPRPSPKHEVAHGDGNRANNYVGNLRWDTRSGNHADKLVHGTHQRGERNKNSKLTNEQAKEAISLRVSGMTTVQIAEKFTVDDETIGKLLRGESWKWLSRPWPVGESGAESVRYEAPRGENSPTSKLTRRQVEEIQHDRRSQRKIAKDYGICQATVSHIKTRKTWVSA